MAPPASPGPEEAAVNLDGLPDRGARAGCRGRDAGRLDGAAATRPGCTASPRHKPRGTTCPQDQDPKTKGRGLAGRQRFAVSSHTPGWAGTAVPRPRAPCAGDAPPGATARRPGAPSPGHPGQHVVEPDLELEHRSSASRRPSFSGGSPARGAGTPPTASFRVTRCVETSAAADRADDPGVRARTGAARRAGDFRTGSGGGGGGRRGRRCSGRSHEHGSRRSRRSFLPHTTTVRSPSAHTGAPYGDSPGRSAWLIDGIGSTVSSRTAPDASAVSVRSGSSVSSRSASRSTALLVGRPGWRFSRSRPRPRRRSSGPRRRSCRSVYVASGTRPRTSTETSRADRGPRGLGLVERQVPQQHRHVARAGRGRDRLDERAAPSPSSDTSAGLSRAARASPAPTSAACAARPPCEPNPRAAAPTAAELLEVVRDHPVGQRLDPAHRRAHPRSRNAPEDRVADLVEVRGRDAPLGPPDRGPGPAVPLEHRPEVQRGAP